MKNLKGTFKSLLLMYNPLELAVVLVVYVGGIGGLYYYLTKSLALSIPIGAIFGFLIFYITSFKIKVLKLQENRLNSILKYVTNMIFYLQVGENIKLAYEMCINASDKYLKEDLKKTLSHLNNTAELKTDHFEVYNFKTLNQFHDNLQIKYENGGDPTELFSHIQRNILFELKKRDQLLKRKTGSYITIVFMIGMITFIPIFLATSLKELWAIYLNTYGDIFLIVFLAFITLILHLAQKNRMDISIRA